MIFLNALQRTRRFVQDLRRNPHQAVEDAPFLLVLIAMPFLLVFELVYKLLYPEEARRKQALYKKMQAAAKVFQSRLDQVALYREGRTILLCKIVRFEVSEHLVRFEAEPVPHAGFSECSDPWHFSIKWDYFFYDDSYWSADSQFLRWSVKFDDQRIEQLCQYALTLAAELDPAERYAELNHFFVHGKEAQPDAASDNAHAEDAQQNQSPLSFGSQQGH